VLAEAFFGYLLHKLSYPANVEKTVSSE